MHAPTPQVPAIQFADLDSLDGLDPALVCEIWLSDVCSAGWVSRDAMKIASAIVQYVLSRAPVVHVSEIESMHNVQREETMRSFKLLKSFYALADYSLEKGGIKAQLRFSLMQKVRLLEAMDRYHKLTQGHADRVARESTAVLRQALAG